MSAKLDLSGKKYVVFGVANNASIAWAIAKRLKECDAEVVLVSTPRDVQRQVRRLADSIGIEHVYGCDVADEQSLKECFISLSEHAPYYGVVHSIAATDGKELESSYLDTTRENFSKTMLVSCFSFTEIARGLLPLMPDGGHMLTLTFAASQQYCPRYNVMGVAKGALEASVKYLAVACGPYKVRVNALSPGPIKSRAARGIPDFEFIGAHEAQKSPFGRLATPEEIADAALYHLSDFSLAVTGQIAYVNNGANIGMMPPDYNMEGMFEAYRPIAERVQKLKDQEK